MNSPDSVRWMFTPDWNIHSRLSKRKEPFKKFGNQLLGNIAFDMEVPKSRLNCTSQKWKGLVYKIPFEPSTWNESQIKQEYIDTTITFIKTLKPYIDNWVKENK
ncbi:hypothetical protein [Aquibacillus albus]|uniref:Uncharacterized protein n=1 Tax=Aquibacillus albus TaxID=1168171 RepID=A0ABS2N3F6_9BACI|nr:hypothetical protein [Aquibacillus albus]MBM7572666.1 hypothetical protein [Aquibacillus albus]